MSFLGALGAMGAGAGAGWLGDKLGLFGGDTETGQVPTMTPEQLKYLNQLMGYYGGQEGPVGPGAGTFGDILSGSLFTPITSERTQEFLEPIQEESRREFEAKTLPSILRGYGAHSGARAFAEQEAREKFGRGLTQQKAQYLYQDELARRQQQTQDIGMRLQALGLSGQFDPRQKLGGLLGMQTFQPYMKDTPSPFAEWMAPMMQLGVSAYGAR